MHLNNLTSKKLIGQVTEKIADPKELTLKFLVILNQNYKLSGINKKKTELSKLDTQSGYQVSSQ